MLKKRGGTHVGFILSFVIFVTFLIFLYSIIIEPTKTGSGKQFILDQAKIKIIENVSSEITVSSINVNNISQNCIRLNNLINDLEINSRIIVKNGLEEIQTSYVLGNDLEIVKSNSSEVFFKIYYSEEFNELDNTEVDPCNPTSYEKGIIRVNEYIFEDNIINLIDEYKNDYENIKEELEIPNEGEFGFSFTYSNKTEISAEKNVTTNIYAEEVQIQYFNENADILLGNLNIKAW